jgi:DNA invertase Pin-like site-specific DNA recombinase
LESFKKGVVLPEPSRNDRLLIGGSERSGGLPRRRAVVADSVESDLSPADSPDGHLVQYARSTGRAARAVRTRVLGYASAYEEHDDAANGVLRRQAEEIASECERRGLHLVEVVRERERKHQRPLTRPGFEYALGRIETEEASGLVVAELHRITRSVPELGRVLDWLSRHDARLVAVGAGLDSDEEAGRLVMRTIIEIARWERQRLVERTRKGMRAARRNGPASVADYPELTERIATMRAQGMTLQAIADQLNADGIPTVRGGVKWRPSSVQAAVGYHRPPAGHMLAPQTEDRGGIGGESRRG